MNFLRGFSQCWWPSPACHVQWEAWAAVGTWLAAIATFLAVLLPHLRQRAAERLRVELAVSEFVQELHGILGQLEGMRVLIADLAVHVPGQHLVTLTINAAFPVIEPIPQLREVIIQIRLLKLAVERLNRRARLAEERLARSPFDYAIETGRLEPLRKAVRKEVKATVEAIRLALPDLAVELPDVR